MQTGSVPTWITFTVAAIALVGPLGGAWINGWITAWREDKRAHREAAERQAERDHETRAYWRDKELEAYIAFSASVTTWRIGLARARDEIRDSGELTPTTKAAIDNLFGAARDAYAPLGVLGAEEVREKATDLIVTMGDLHKHIASGNERTTRDALHKLRSFNAATRHALGIELPTSINPSPPSGTTS